MENTNKDRDKIKENTPEYGKWIELIASGTLALVCYLIGSNNKSGSLLNSILVPISCLIAIVFFVQLIIMLFKK